MHNNIYGGAPKHPYGSNSFVFSRL